MANQKVMQGVLSSGMNTGLVCYHNQGLMSMPVKLVISKTYFTSMSCSLSLSGWYDVLVFCFEEGTHLLKQLGFKSATKPAHYRVHQV